MRAQALNFSTKTPSTLICRVNDIVLLVAIEFVMLLTTILELVLTLPKKMMTNLFKLQLSTPAGLGFSRLILIDNISTCTAYRLFGKPPTGRLNSLGYFKLRSVPQRSTNFFDIGL